MNRLYGNIIIMSLSIQREKRNRVIAIILPIVITAIILVFLKLTGRVLI